MADRWNEKEAELTSVLDECNSISATRINNVAKVAVKLIKVRCVLPRALVSFRVVDFAHIARCSHVAHSRICIQYYKHVVHTVEKWIRVGQPGPLPLYVIGANSLPPNTHMFFCTDSIPIPGRATGRPRTSYITSNAVQARTPLSFPSRCHHQAQPAFAGRHRDRAGRGAVRRALRAAPRSDARTCAARSFCSFNRCCVSASCPHSMTCFYLWGSDCACLYRVCMCGIFGIIPNRAVCFASLCACFRTRSGHCLIERGARPSGQGARHVDIARRLLRRGHRRHRGFDGPLWRRSLLVGLRTATTVVLLISVVVVIVVIVGIQATADLASAGRDTRTRAPSVRGGAHRCTCGDCCFRRCETTGGRSRGAIDSRPASCAGPANGRQRGCCQRRPSHGTPATTATTATAIPSAATTTSATIHSGAACRRRRAVCAAV